ncbi:MAG TPA: hypothetical protein VH720_02225 [Candidatus Limnocylindrales bacterium]
MDEPRLRISTPHTHERGRGLRIEHRHGDDWLALTPGLPMLTPEPNQRRWVVLYRCTIECGHTVTSEVPA